MIVIVIKYIFVNKACSGFYLEYHKRKNHLDELCERL